MPIIEVDDVTAAAMQQNGVKYQDRTQASATALKTLERINQLENGPNRTAYLRLLKEQFPDLQIPEIDAAKPVNDRVDQLAKLLEEDRAERKKEREDREESERKEKASSTVSQGRGWLRSKQKLDDEGVKAVEEMMQDRGIADYEAAYHLWHANQPAPPVDLPSNALGRSLDWFKEEENQPDKKLLLQDPMRYRSKRAGQILADIRAGKIDEFGRPTNRAA